MTTYVVLRFEDDAQAQTLVEDMRAEPDRPILTPVQENDVRASVVNVGRQGAGLAQTYLSEVEINTLARGLAALLGHRAPVADAEGAARVIYERGLQGEPGAPHVYSLATHLAEMGSDLRRLGGIGDHG